jgi:hypothetical protein
MKHPHDARHRHHPLAFLHLPPWRAVVEELVSLLVVIGRGRSVG